MQSRASSSSKWRFITTTPLEPGRPRLKKRKRSPSHDRGGDLKRAEGCGEGRTSKRPFAPGDELVFWENQLPLRWCFPIAREEDNSAVTICQRFFSERPPVFPFRLPCPALPHRDRVVGEGSDRAMHVAVPCDALVREGAEHVEPIDDVIDPNHPAKSHPGAFLPTQSAGAALPWRSPRSASSNRHHADHRAEPPWP